MKADPDRILAELVSEMLIAMQCAVLAEDPRAALIGYLTAPYADPYEGLPPVGTDPEKWLSQNGPRRRDTPPCQVPDCSELAVTWGAEFAYCEDHDPRGTHDDPWGAQEMLAELSAQYADGAATMAADKRRARRLRAYRPVVPDSPGSLR